MQATASRGVRSSGHADGAVRRDVQRWRLAALAVDFHDLVQELVSVELDVGDTMAMSFSLLDICLTQETLQTAFDEAEARYQAERRALAVMA
jgi:hypothetical protein